MTERIKTERQQEREGHSGWTRGGARPAGGERAWLIQQRPGERNTHTQPAAAAEGRPGEGRRWRDGAGLMSANETDSGEAAQFGTCWQGGTRFQEDEMNMSVSGKIRSKFTGRAWREERRREKGDANTT